MCGIIGVFNRNNSAGLVLEGMKLLKSRGKDGFGIFIQDKEAVYSKSLNALKTKDKSKYSMGHNLHSIVNFVQQPMVKKTSVFASNCEIYNWQELKRDNRLSAENDAETLFELLEKKGMKALDEIDGVYAFAYWTKKTLCLARDIIGVKPLWYSTNEGFAFASEKKALEALGYLDIEELNPRKILCYDIQNNTIQFTERRFFRTTPEHRKAKEKIATELEFLLKQALLKRIPDRKFGLLFSGGIDSTVLAVMLKNLNIGDFTCYTAVLKDSMLSPPKDLEYAKKIAKELGLKLKTVEIPLSKVPLLLKDIVPLIEDTNVVKAGVALPFYAACLKAKADGCKVIFSGLGSEEIFAGYERHRNSADINKECLSGLLKIYERDLYRDDVITMQNNLELRLPLLDKQLVEYCLRIPARYKLSRENSKLILRYVARNLGIREQFASRKKTAAQYGSNFHKALKKLTKKASERYISAYLRQFYPRHNLRLGCLFSSGKDSSYALYVMMRQNYAIECLISLKSKNKDSYMFHTPNIELTRLQAEAMDIPLLMHTTEGKKEEELKDLREALKQAKKEYKLEGIVTGALWSNYQRERIEKICDSLGLKIFAPLWHISQEQEMRELLSHGFEIMMSSIAAYGLDENWLNRKLTGKDIDRLAKLNKQIGFNVAGEGGEYESLVVDAPMFRKRLKIIKYSIEKESENVARLIVKKAILVKK